METRLKNHWVSDIRAAITPALEACTSSDLPTYLVMGGKRIPFEVERWRLIVNDKGNVEGLEIHLPQDGSARNCDRFVSGDARQDADNALRAWEEYCEAHPELPPSSKTAGAFPSWLFESKKGS